MVCALMQKERDLYYYQDGRHECTSNQSALAPAARLKVRALEEHITQKGGAQWATA